MTQQTEQGTVWLTQDAFDKLKAELENLKGPVRQEIVNRISAAREEATSGGCFICLHCVVEILRAEERHVAHDSTASMIFV